MEVELAALEEMVEHWLPQVREELLLSKILPQVMVQEVEVGKGGIMVV